jgi:predicted RNA binding protein YcfA (HicA-like mRNA interferase family)
MKVSEFVRQLKKQGINFEEHGKKHDKYVNPETGQSARIPRHQSQEIRTGTREQILKDLGLK